VTRGWILLAFFGLACSHGSLVIRNVSVVDVENGTTRAGQTVVVKRSAAGREVLDGSGKYLIPGLWDMHVHIAGNEAALPALLRHGITGARVMAGDTAVLGPWQREIAAGERSGPRLFVAGIDFIKIHELPSRDAYFAAVEQARAKGIPFVGHVPDSMTPIEVSDAGQKSIEHLEFIPNECLVLFNDRKAIPPPRCAPDELRALIRHLVRNGSWLDPTIGSFRNFAPQLWPAIAAGFRSVVPLLREERVALLAGTDMGSMGIVPGASLHDELALWVEAGFSPAEALRAATVDPLRFLGIERQGDFVLLDANPLANIANTRRIAAVIQSGRIVILGDRALRDGF
jgi:imidazolonepropionase-like amidohydrolase